MNKNYVRSFLFFLMVIEFIGAEGQNKNLRMTILYDNYTFCKDTRADWGFSCFIEGKEKSILFDTGTEPEILLYNMKKLGIEIDDIESIVISHNHSDHIGSLFALVSKNPNVQVYLINSVSKKYLELIKKTGATVKLIKDTYEICPGVYSTGEMGESLKEQSLVIETSKGPVVISGCTHQGVSSLLYKTKEMTNQPIFLILGGFHLIDKTGEEIKKSVVQFKKFGVKLCAPSHCTGEKAIILFKAVYGKNYIPLGTGRVIEFPKN